jgi:SAM-dependent methyltransferase
VVATCPLCGGCPDRALNTFTSEEVASFFLPRALFPDRHPRLKALLDGVWPGKVVSVVACDRCEFAYASPFVAGSAEFYALEAPDTAYPRDKWEYRRTLEALDRFRGASTTALDIGAGKGYFLSQLIKRSWKPGNLVATEFSAAGRVAVARLGIECHARDIRILDLDRAFDVITMFQVLEHLDGYDELFRALARLSKPDTELFIAVPNGERISYNESLRLLIDAPPNHISRWSPRSFQVLARRYGWTLVACEREPPATAVQDIAYAAIHRFVRLSRMPGSCASAVYQMADRRFCRASRANKIAKAAGMMLFPSVWAAAATAARHGRSGRIPHALWVHLRRTP